MRLSKSALRKQTALAKYFTNSVIVTVLDIGIVWVLTRLYSVDLVLANTIGVVTGFAVHYLLSSKSVFAVDYGAKGFFIYLLTFILGLFLANWLIYISYEYVFSVSNKDLRLLLSKVVSVVVPFFVLYYLRRYLYSLVRYPKAK